MLKFDAAELSRRLVELQLDASRQLKRRLNAILGVLITAMDALIRNLEVCCLICHRSYGISLLSESLWSGLQQLFGQLGSLLGTTN